MTIKTAQLLHIHPQVGPALAAYAPALDKAMQRYRIISTERKAAFIAQFAYELGRLEKRYGERQQDIQRGLLQITRQAPQGQQKGPGGGTTEQHLDWLEQLEWVAMSAAWWWSLRGMNRLADAGCFDQITLRISGDAHDLEDRLTIWRRAVRTFAEA
ncbi:hypothetical protein IB256_27445 [Pseudomonas sp. PDM17]|uniref:hypothetical protein n=1 Tax=Pseudomonas sp. PDM17 TaxID=2769285 RepID=UPI00177E4834|nr:hypothetical protein [Pseudomonas sp. PDM17]MBD9504544.1 hypothetical protein [Pseudomonas sp. PDM17]